MSDFDRDEVHHRHFYHLRYHGHPLTTWLHEELHPSEGPAHKLFLFEFFWAPLPHAIPPLIADHGIMLPQLLEVLSLTNRRGKSRLHSWDGMRAPFLFWRIGWRSIQPTYSFSLTLLNISFDHLRRDMACCSHVVAARPKMVLSAHLFEAREWCV
jgi:hypothetical protein